MKILNYDSLSLDKVYKVAHFVREGETISAQEQNQFLGGKGLNQSVALARAGIFVEHAGAVGRETTEFHALLKAEGAGTTYLRVLETVSGHAVIQSCAGQNCIIVYGGANRMTRPQDVDAFLKDYGPGDLLLLQNETSCVRYAMEQAREKGMTVILITHNSAIAPMADRVIQIKNGKVSKMTVNPHPVSVETIEW